MVVNKSYKGLIFAIIISFVLIQQISYATITAEIGIEPSFKVGDIIKFNYTISSNEEQEITYIEFVDCPSSPKPMATLKSYKLIPSSALKGEYTYIEVTEDTKSQNCTAYIQLLNPIEKNFSKTFTIDTLPDIEFRILICKESSCKTESKTFLKNSNIYLSYSSDVAGINTKTTLTYPNNTTKQINLPTSIKAEQIGTYKLEVIASKNGYRSNTQSAQFGVIEEEAEVEETSTCFINNKCELDKGENYKTCPQDCHSGSKDGYCDKVIDKICDPDCSQNQDIDCKIAEEKEKNKVKPVENETKPTGGVEINWEDETTLVIIISGLIGLIIVSVIIFLNRGKVVK
jgi:hypothetical protein